MAGVEINLTQQSIETIRGLSYRAQDIKLEIQREIHEATFVRQPEYIQLHTVNPDFDENDWVDHEEFQGWILLQGICSVLACAPNILIATKSLLDEFFVYLCPAKISLNEYKNQIVELHNEIEVFNNNLLDKGLITEQDIEIFNMKLTELTKEESQNDFLIKVSDYYNIVDDFYRFLDGLFNEEQAQEDDEQDYRDNLDKPKTQAPFQNTLLTRISRRDQDLDAIKADPNAAIPDALICPISHTIMSEPVMLIESGMTYEKHG